MKMPPLDQLGRPGIVGIGLLIFSLVFYVGNIAPAQDELGSLKNEATRLAAAARPGDSTAEGAGTGAGKPPPFSSATDSLKELSDLAEQHGLKIDRGSYSLSDKDGQRRLEVTLPLKAAYAPLRGYLSDLLSLPAGPVLDELLLQRQKSTDTVLEANVRLSYYFAPPP